MSTVSSRAPAAWLITLIAGLPLFSETAYTPSLPDIAHFMRVPGSWIEYTLTIYLFGFSVGTFFFGNLSDRYGRKPCMVVGFLIYLLGCIGCYQADNFEWLMISRFIQAFGGSVGSVLGQAICRDAFQGPALGKIYASVGAALALFPAIGPIIGGGLDQYYGWSSVFLLLVGCGVMMVLLVQVFLPETLHKSQRHSVSIPILASRMIRDPHVIACALLVGLANAINFSYYAEGSFYLIERLGLTPSYYGFTFIGLATTMMLAGMLSHRLHNRWPSTVILRWGIYKMLIGASVFSGLIVLREVLDLGTRNIIIITISSMMIISAGVCWVASNALVVALRNYRDVVGTASSLFGGFYYAIISLFTFGMGMLHNGTLLPMPLYFLTIGIMVFAVERYILRISLKKEKIAE